MNADIARKTCKMCTVEIPEAARKCPHCHHFQNRLTMFMYHPAFAVVGASLPLGIMLIGISAMFDRGENYESYKDQITIAESQMAFGDTKSGETIAVLGTIKNSGPVPWKDITFHADFTDADGRKMDVGQKEVYSFYLPPNATSSFKLSFQREFPQTNYARHTVRVVAAKDARARW